MRLLLIGEECGTGSTGRICTDIATAFEAEGKEPKIAYGRNTEIIPSQFLKYAVRIGNKRDLMLHGLKARMFDAAGFGSTRATKEFLKWVEEYDPDIIHLHNLHGYYINVELLFNYLKGCGKKVIWTLHDVWAFTGHSAYCDVVQCEKWRDGCGNCPQMKVYPKSYIDRSKQNWKKKREIFTGVENLTIVTPSHWLEGLVKESFLKDYPIKVIHNGIDTSKFYPMKSDFRETHGLEGKFLICGVASVWNDLKGFSDFIKLAGMIDEDCRIVLVGGMDEALERTLPLNIIHIKKTQDIHEMAEIYNMADVYVNLTYCDTYPTVNLEAAACGTPVITYDVGGSTESALKYGGAAVKRGDLAGIVEALKRIEKVTPGAADEIDRKFTTTGYIRLYGEK